MMTKKITIIVPVYNGWEFCEKCIDHLIKYIGTHHDILIINDASIEMDFEEKILIKINNYSNIKYYKNRTNLGFVKTCNKAVFELDKTQNDVLLLNSDAYITENALEEMMEVMYLHDRHAVVNPRSNNATLATIPFEKSINLEESYRLWKQKKDMLPRFQAVPTAIGFCMLIRRDVINNFGLFDEIYSSGYNEENDFVCRINKIGYSAILANRSFVFHDEGLSFGDRKNSRREKFNNSKYTLSGIFQKNYGIL